MHEDLAGEAAEVFEMVLDRQIKAIAKAVRKGDAWEQAIEDKELTQALAATYRDSFKTFAKATFNAIDERHAKSWGEQELLAWTELVAAWIKQEAAKKVADITATTVKFVRSILDAAVAEGASIPQIARGIEDAFIAAGQGDAINRTRATRIARTEVIAASNRGSIEGARSTGLPMRKVWLSALQPDRTRDSHQDANGQSVAIEDLFALPGGSLDHPGDTSNGADASETINCRCTLIYEVDE